MKATGRVDKAVEKRAEDIIGKMKLEEKIEMLGGVDIWYSRSNKALGIPVFKMADGPLGVRWKKSNAYPSGVAMYVASPPKKARNSGG